MQKGNVVRENTVPHGGATQVNVQGVAGGGMLLPDTIQVQEMADVFFENSEQNYLQLDSISLIPGRQTQFKLQNVGLGEGLELFITGSFGVQNTTAGVVTFNVSPEFPYNIISNLQLMFNGKVALINASGYELLRMMLKRNFGKLFVTTFDSLGTSAAQSMRIDRRVANMTVTGGTPTAGDTLTGVTSFTVAAAATATVAFEMYLDISFVLRKDLPFGLVPMQHNAIYANVTINTNSLLSATFDTPLQTPVMTGLNILNPVITGLPTYNFWGLPAQAQLYNFFVNNSYVITGYPRNPINNVGSRALAFNFPLNFWLISSMFTIRHGVNQALANIRSNVDNPHLVYNGTIHVDRTDIRTRTAREITNTGRVYPYGTLMFDGAQTNNLDGNSMNMSRWLNMYQANNPMYYADMIGITVPASFDVLLEQLIPNYVTVL